MDIYCTPLITYPDFTIITITAGDWVNGVQTKYFYLERGETVAREVEHVYSMPAEQYEHMDITEILGMCTDDYNISGETNDCEYYIFFKFVD